MDNLISSETGRPLGIDEVTDFLRGANPDVFTGQLAKDVVRLKRAGTILRDEIKLAGLTYFNLRTNVNGMMPAGPSSNTRTIPAAASSPP